MSEINSFSGEYRWLSNFYMRAIDMEGYCFASAEHAYQASKCVSMTDFKKVINSFTPGQAKRAGMTIKLRPDWEDVKLSVMTEIVHAKFDQYNDLKRQLIMTHPVELIEGNHWGDTYWGVCKGVGENHLGKILMELRDSYV